MTSTPLGQGHEFDRIRAIAKGLGSRAPELGNDCAFIPDGDRTLALTTDVSVERVHFRREWLSFEEIGWRAAAGSLSDLAAAGAEPIGVLVALTMPAAESEAAFVSVMAGIGAAVAAAGGVVLGGDLSRGESIAIAVTAAGFAERPMRRRGAQPGDEVWVTGELGGARAALAAWNAGRAPDPGARARFAKPEPRIAAGHWLAAHGATAMLDLSDGLAGDAGHLAAASGVKVRIALEQVPCHPAVAAEASLAGEFPAGFAARGGEDYELLVTLPPGRSGSPGVPLTRIGQVSAGSGVRLELNGSPVVLAGYDHFA